MDFTIKQHQQFLKTLQKWTFSFQTFDEFTREQKPKAFVLRHDVDKLPVNSLHFARIQSEMRIKGSYYFRAIPKCWDENIIKEIADLGHEVGYHYENMDTCKGDIDKAWDDFRYNLERLRKLVDVKTICMHGSPRSKFDNKDIWKKYEYRSLGIIGEPYFDVNFNKVLYLTDTGRRWDGWQTSVRDKVPQQKEWIKKGLVFHTTEDIINAVNKKILPNQIMFTFHPQRWHDKKYPWLKELILQNAKNQVKGFLIKGLKLFTILVLPS